MYFSIFIFALILFLIGIFFTRWLFGIPTIIANLKEQTELLRWQKQQLGGKPNMTIRDIAGKEKEIAPYLQQLNQGKISQDEYNSIVASIITK